MIATDVPTFFAGSSDEEDDALRHLFEVWSTTGSAPLRSGWSSFVPAEDGTLGSWEVPSDVLHDGGTYRWRALSSDAVANAPAWSDWCEFTVDSTLAEPLAQTQLFFDAIQEHQVGPGPGAAESALRLTPQGQDRFSELTAEEDAIRVAEGASPTPQHISIFHMQRPVRTSTAVTFSMRLHQSTGWSPDSPRPPLNDEMTTQWTVTLKRQESGWAVDSAAGSFVVANPPTGEPTVTTQDVGRFDSKVDYPHLSVNRAGHAVSSVHGWWILKEGDPKHKAKIGLWMYAEYGRRWVFSGYNDGIKRAKNYAGGRVTTKAVCGNTSTQRRWYAVVDVDILNEPDSPERAHSVANVACGYPPQ